MFERNKSIKFVLLFKDLKVLKVLPDDLIASVVSRNAANASKNLSI